jgi:putative DNA primase/helicase
MTTSTDFTLEAYASAKRLPVEELEQWGVRTEGRMVAMPYYGTDGQASGAMRYRHALKGPQRFSWEPGQTPTLYGLQFIPAARETGTIVLVEGESDTHTLWHHGYSALGVPGASSFKDEWRTHFDGFDVVYVVVEDDNGGKQLVSRIAEQPSKFKALIRLITPTHHKDVSALHIADPEQFKVRFDAALEGAEPWASYADRQAWVQDLEQEQKTPKQERVPILTLLSDVEPEEVSWLWQDRLAQGKYNVLAGMPDLGKITVALDIAARMSVGGTWPDGTVCPQGPSIIMTAEDGIADTIVPRIITLGGDRTQIAVLEGMRDKTGRGPVNLDHDLDMLEQAIEDFQPLLVIIDPLTAYLGDINSHHDAAVRRLLEPVIKMLEQRRVALLGIAHLNKNQTLDLMHRISGSGAIVQTARGGMFCGKHPHDPDRRVLAQFKKNLSDLPRSLDYILDGGGLTWDENAPDIPCEELVNTPSPEEKSVVDEAEEFLSEYLNRGPAKHTDVVRAARANAVSERTLRRAKQRLNVQTRKVGFGPSSYTEWSLLSEDSLTIDVRPENITPKVTITPKVAKESVGQLCEHNGKNVSQAKPVANFGTKEVTEI